MATPKRLPFAEANICVILPSCQHAFLGTKTTDGGRRTPPRKGSTCRTVRKMTPPRGRAPSSLDITFSYKLSAWWLCFLHNWCVCVCECVSVCVCVCVCACAVCVCALCVLSVCVCAVCLVCVWVGACVRACVRAWLGGWVLGNSFLRLFDPAWSWRPDLARVIRGFPKASMSHLRLRLPFDSDSRSLFGGWWPF